MKQSSEEPDDLIGIADAVTLTKRTRSTVHTWVRDGKLRRFEAEDGKRLLVSKSELMELHAASPTKGAKTGNDRSRKKERVSNSPPHKKAETTAPGKDIPSAADPVTPAIENVLLARVNFHQDTQVREKIDPETVTHYAERMRAGDRFQPVILFSNGKADGDLFVGDGWHRLKAASQNECQRFPAEVRPGGLDAAIDYALSANATHGKPRTHKDIRRAVGMAIKRYPDHSNRQIAKLCAVDDKTVAVHRDRCGNSAPEKRKGADGKSYPVKRAARKKKVTQAEGSYRRVKKAVRKLERRYQERLHELLTSILAGTAEES